MFRDRVNVTNTQRNVDIQQALVSFMDAFALLKYGMLAVTANDYVIIGNFGMNYRPIVITTIVIVVIVLFLLLLIPFMLVYTINTTTTTTTTTKIMKYFINMLCTAEPIYRRLVATPLERKRYETAEACARDCLNYPATVCVSFNYDYGKGGSCELLSNIEGHTATLRKVNCLCYPRKILGYYLCPLKCK